MNLFVQNYIVQAEPANDQNGIQGYNVYYPDGRTEWHPLDDFELHHRVLDQREKMLIDMNTQELQVLRITDPDYLDLEDPDAKP